MCRVVQLCNKTRDMISHKFCMKLGGIGIPYVYKAILTILKIPALLHPKLVLGWQKLDSSLPHKLDSIQCMSVHVVFLLLLLEGLMVSAT